MFNTIGGTLANIRMVWLAVLLASTGPLSAQTIYLIELDGNGLPPQATQWLGPSGPPSPLKPVLFVHGHSLLNDEQHYRKTWTDEGLG